jgi:hypothetical protein
MNEASKHWLGAFGGLRVPFDPKTIFLGFLAVIVFVCGVAVINIFADQDQGYLVSRTLYTVASYLGTNAVKAFNAVYALVPGNRAAENILQQPPHLRVLLAVLVWAIFVWAVFAGIISRITAYRIAKDEALSVGNALKFTWRHKFSLFLTPFCIASLIGVFYLCNWLAGYMITLFPGIGPVLFVFPVFILVLISTLFIILLLIVLLLGLHLIASAIGVEGCDGTEAFINVFDYIYSRPWSYILYHASMVVSVLFLIWLGGLAIDIAFHSSSVSSDEKITAYQFSKQYEAVEVSRIGHVSEKYYLKQSEGQDSSDQEGIPYYQAGMKDVWAYIRQVHVYAWVYKADKNEIVADDLHTMRFQELWRLDKLWACIGGALAFIYLVLQMGVWGYAFAYVCAASTTIYFLLRKEVGSTEFDEIWEDEIQELAAPAAAAKKEAEKNKGEAAKVPAVATPAEAKKEEAKTKTDVPPPEAKKDAAVTAVESKKEVPKETAKELVKAGAEGKKDTPVPVVESKKEEAKPGIAAPVSLPVTPETKKEGATSAPASSIVPPAITPEIKKEAGKPEIKEIKPLLTPEAKKEGTSVAPPFAPAVAPDTQKEMPKETLAPSVATAVKKETGIVSLITEAQKEAVKEEIKPKVEAGHTEPKKETGLLVPILGEAKKETAKEEAKPKLDMPPVITAESKKEPAKEEVKPKLESRPTEPAKPAIGLHFEPPKPQVPESKPAEVKKEDHAEPKKEEAKTEVDTDGKKKDSKVVETGTMAIPLIRRRGADEKKMEEKKPEEKKPEEKKDKKFMD